MTILHSTPGLTLENKDSEGVGGGGGGPSSFIAALCGQQCYLAETIQQFVMSIVAREFAAIRCRVRSNDYRQRPRCILPNRFQAMKIANWRADWAWGFPLIVLTVVIHVLGLGTFVMKAVGVSSRMFERHHPIIVFVSVIGTTTLLATCLHACRGRHLGRRLSPARRAARQPSAMLYSLNAITSYGHAELMLKDHWQLMGALEALNGWLLFGLSTAFLFGTIEKVWSSGEPALSSLTASLNRLR